MARQGLRIAVDTNRYTDLARGNASALEIVRRASQVIVPFVVVGELRAGFLNGTLAAENEQTLMRFLRDAATTVLFPDDDTTHHYAQLYKQLRDRGRMIPTNDLWVAALVMQHGLILYARDKHFEHLPQIPRI